MAANNNGAHSQWLDAEQFDQLVAVLQLGKILGYSVFAVFP